MEKKRSIVVDFDVVTTQFFMITRFSLVFQFRLKLSRFNLLQTMLSSVFTIEVEMDQKNISLSPLSTLLYAGVIHVDHTP